MWRKIESSNIFQCDSISTACFRYSHTPSLSISLAASSLLSLISFDNNIQQSTFYRIEPVFFWGCIRWRRRSNEALLFSVFASICIFIHFHCNSAAAALRISFSIFVLSSPNIVFVPFSCIRLFVLSLMQGEGVFKWIILKLRSIQWNAIQR